jgi:hypothetical protein
MIYNCASGWKEVKSTSLVSAWKNIIYAAVEQQDFEELGSKN